MSENLRVWMGTKECYTGERRVGQRKMKWEMAPTCSRGQGTQRRRCRCALEIIPIKVVGFSRPELRSNYALTPPLCERRPSRPRVLLIYGTRRGLPS